MRKIVLATLIIICGVVIVVSFFRPWAKAVTSPTKIAGGLKDAISDTLKDTGIADKLIAKVDTATATLNRFENVRFQTVVSGYELPVMVNRETSKTALSLVQIFDPKAADIGKKVLLVYLIPAGALLCIALAFLGMRHDIFVAIMAVLSGVVAAVGLTKLMTTDIANNVVQITIEMGLWQTLYSYLLICVFSVVWLVWDMSIGKVE